jgi:nicotinate phosphoribosyltransferase
VKLFTSGGLDEESIPELNEYANGYGVGTSISNAPVIDFSMDIVEIDGEPMAKRGKCSGKKSVYRCERCLSLEVLPSSAQAPGNCRCGGVLGGALKEIACGGEVSLEKRNPREIRDSVLVQLKTISD